MLNEANDGKLILSTSFDITQGPDKIITIKDVTKRKSMRIGKSNQKEGEAGKSHESKRLFELLT